MGFGGIKGFARRVSRLGSTLTVATAGVSASKGTAGKLTTSKTTVIT